MPVVLKNNASNSLAAAITSTDTGVVVRNGNLFPALAAGQYFYATITGADGSQEIVKVTARSGNGMTIVRAQEGTFALPFQLDSRFEMRITAATIADILAEDDLAATVTIADAGGYYTGGTVEAALQEVGSILTTVPVARGGTAATTADNALVNLAAQKKFAQVRKDVATLLADTTITYTAGTVNSVTTGDVVQTAAEGFSYSVAASGASDQHVTTAGGVKLYVRPINGIVAATAFGALGNGVADDTAELQAAINGAFAQNCDCYIPAGTYLVTGLYLPGRVSGGTDDRGKAIRIFGQGTGEPFVVTNPSGTVIKSVTNAPVLQDYLDGASNSNGQVTIDHIRFDGTSTTPVVKLQSFYGLSTIHDCVIYQRSTGDGLTLGWGATVSVRSCYVLNKDWATFGLGAARVGTGISYAPTADNGLVTISKCTSRGWLTGYSIGGGGGTAYSASIQDCECSVVWNGIALAATADKCSIVRNYLEGGDGGVGISNAGDYNTITDNLIFAGFAKGIEDTSTSNIGTLISGNLVGLGATANAIGIDVASSAAFGGYNKNVVNNSISYTLGTNGVNGIKLSGTDPRVTILGNSFDPRGNWTGTSTLKINDTSSNGAYGIVQSQLGDLEIPVLSHGALAIEQGVFALTQANVSSNTLTIPSAGSYFALNASSPCTVQSISAGVVPGRVVVFRADTANMTFQDTASIQLAGGASFSGPGTLTLLVDRIGGSNFAYEIARAVF